MAKAKVNGGMIRPEKFRACGIPLHDLDLPCEGQAHIWYLDLGRLGLSLQHALAGEPDQTPGPRLTLGQLKFARRFYLRLLLGAYLDVPGKSVRINRSKRGKPMLDKAAHPVDLQFSMAKSGDRLLIGISTATLVGVDLEPAGRQAHDALGVAKRYFSVSEARGVEAAGPAQLGEAFLRTWACKEAVVKASGHGIANQFSRFSVETDLKRPPSILEFEDDDPQCWSLAVVQPDNGFIGAVAMHHPRMEITAFSLSSN